MTNAELAILNLLAERPLYGYEIERIIEVRGVREWTDIGFSSIYYLLKKLERKGFLQATNGRRYGHLPARRTYQLTSAGKSTWRQAALKALSDPHPGSSSLMQGLTNLPRLNPEEIREALITYCQRLLERRDHVLQRRQAATVQMSPQEQVIFDYSLTMIKAELDWVTHLMTNTAVSSEDANTPIHQDLPQRPHQRAMTGK